MGRKYETRELIPTNCIAVTETEYPKGFRAARYDREGFCSDGRWFETREAAERYADAISHS